jgi:hypothetical protein
MMSVDQIKPFTPAQRINRREKAKDEKQRPRENAEDRKPSRKRGPGGGHRVDELA